MATDQEALDAGMALPQGTDMMSGGDDAIRQNAKATVDLHKLAKYYVGENGLPMPPQPAPDAPWWDALDLLPSGIYTIWNGGVTQRYGIPANAQCSLEVQRWGAAGGIAIARTREIPTQVFQAARLSEGWGDGFEKTSGGGTAGASAHRMLPAASAGYKKAAVDCTTGYGGAVFSGSGTTVVVQSIHAQADLLDVHIRNWNPRYINPDRPSATLSSVRVGRHLGNGAGTEWIALRSGSTGTDGYHSETIQIPAGWRGGEVAVEYTWSGTEISRCIGTAWTNGSADGVPPMFVWLGTRVPASVPVLGVIASSSGAGVGSARPLVDSWLGRLARRVGGVATFWANSGDTALAWLGDTDRKYQRYTEDVAAPDVLFYALLSNDWAAGASLAELIDRMHQHVEQIREHILVPIYGTTITPRTTPPSNDNDRKELNSYMPISGLFEWVFDFDAALALPDGTLDPSKTSDGTHANDVGQEDLNQAVDIPVVISPAP